MKKFRVLVIDDNEEVLSRIPKKVYIQQRNFERKNYLIELHLVHVEIVPSDASKYSISNSTIKKLASVCSKPFNLILSDFGYAQKEVTDKLRIEANNGKRITKEDLVGKVLTTADLAIEVKSTCKSESFNSKEKKGLTENFINSYAKFYLYTYSSKEFYEALGEVPERATITQSHFKNIGKIDPIDTKGEFYNGNEFDWPNESKHSGEFYAHLVGKLINQIIQLEFTEFILNDSKRLKFLQTPRSIYSVAVIVAIAGAIGAMSEWLGAEIFKLSVHNEISTAILFGCITIIVIFIIGLLLPKIFEHSITRFLSVVKNNDEVNK